MKARPIAPPITTRITARRALLNADIPADGISVHFVKEYDPHASPIGVKGMGEIRATGVDAAVADAVFDAVGTRIRDLPLNPPRILAALADATTDASG